MIELRIRHGRTPISWCVGVFSLALGLFGLIVGADVRSNAVENAFPDLLATAWYACLALGAACLILAAAKPWPEALTLDNAYCMVNRLYLERAGLFMVGWVWQSYCFAAFAIQGVAGATAGAIATIIGTWTGIRIREQFVDLPALRAWIDVAEGRVEAEGT